MSDSTVNGKAAKSHENAKYFWDVGIKAVATILIGLLFNDVRQAMLKIERLQEWAAQWKNYPSDRNDLQRSITTEVMDQVDTKLFSATQVLQKDVVENSRLAAENSRKLDTLLRIQRGLTNQAP
jgi:hypothetical protein